MNVRRGLTVLFSLAVLAAAALVVAGPATAATSTKVVEFNAADGKACQSRCLAPLVPLLTADVDVVTLQEVCRNDLDGFAAAHGLHYTFAYQTAADARCNGSDRGNAVVSRYELGGIPEYVLDAPGTATGNRFTLLCAIVHKPGLRLRACSTHLIAGKNAAQASQVKQIIADTAGARQNNQRVIVAGDFNMQPGTPAIAPMNNSFSQRHPANTAGVNVEYVWFHSQHLAGISSARADGGSSDHAILVSTAGL